MDILGALLLMIVMYIFIPVAACLITIRLVEGSRRNRGGALQPGADHRDGALDHR